MAADFVVSMTETNPVIVGVALGFTALIVGLILWRFEIITFHSFVKAMELLGGSICLLYLIIRPLLQSQRPPTAAWEELLIVVIAAVISSLIAMVASKRIHD